MCIGIPTRWIQFEDTRRLVLFVIILLIAAAGLVPITGMFKASIFIDGHLSLDHYKEVLRLDGAGWRALVNGLKLGLWTSLVSVLLGLTLGVLLAKTDVPFRRAFIAIFCIPLLVPPYIMAFGWIKILGRQGLVASMFWSEIADQTSVWLYGLPGSVFVLSTVFLPVVVVFIVAHLNSVDRRLEETGLIYGNWARVLGRITLPLVLPSILFSMTLVFVLSTGELSVPFLLRYPVFAAESFTQFAAFYNYGAATAASLPFLAVAFFLIAMERLTLGPHRRESLLAGSGSTLIIKLGRFRFVMLALIATLAGLIVFLPLSALVREAGSLTSYFNAVDAAGDSLARSIVFAAVGATLLSMTGFICAYTIHTKALPLSGAIDIVTVFVFALPATVLGLGLIGLWNTSATAFVYSSALIIILGYIGQFTALSSRIVLAGMASMPKSMEEAARIVGVNWIKRLVYIVIPLARHGLTLAWMVSFVFCFRDVGISILVHPAGQETLPVRIFQFMANGPPNLVAALCVILVASSTFPFMAYLAWHFKDRT